MCCEQIIVVSHRGSAPLGSSGRLEDPPQSCPSEGKEMRVFVYLFPHHRWGCHFQEPYPVACSGWTEHAYVLKVLLACRAAEAADRKAWPCQRQWRQSTMSRASKEHLHWVSCLVFGSSRIFTSDTIMFHQRSPTRGTWMRSSKALPQSSERAQVWNCLLDCVSVQFPALSVVSFLWLLSVYS